MLGVCYSLLMSYSSFSDFLGHLPYFLLTNLGAYGLSKDSSTVDKNLFRWEARGVGSSILESVKLRVVYGLIVCAGSLFGSYWVGDRLNLVSFLKIGVMS